MDGEERFAKSIGTYYWRFVPASNLFCNSCESANQNWCVVHECKLHDYTEYKDTVNGF